MAADAQLNGTYNHFMENHILIRDDWLKCALNHSIQAFPTLTGPRLYALLFDQWLYSNLKDSCYPVLESIDAQERKFEVHQPLILQITSLIDIGSSLLSQFNKLTYEFVDNSGFDVDPSEQTDDNIYQPKPSRCLMLTLSDGEFELKAMERRSIPSLSLLTTPGCKVLLLPPLICRKGVFLLTPHNTQVLGGDDQQLMDTGRPLDVMARRLNKEIPKKRDFSHLNTRRDEVMDQDQMIREFEEMEEQFDPADFEPVPSTPLPPRPSLISPSVSTPMPRPPPRSIVSSTPVTPIHTHSPPLTNTQSTSSTTRSLHISSPLMERDANRSVKVKEEPIEVIDIDDDAVPSTSTGGNTTKKEEVADVVNESDPFVIAYRSLRLITLQEAAKQSKYQTGGSKRKIEAFVHSFVEALRIVDNMWTMKIQLKDESVEDMECIIHSSVLERLIGLSVDEAMAIRSSSDMARKQEGASRLAATEDILSRLDLIWTIEFFPAKSKVTPIVRDVQSLAEILNAFD